MDNEELFKQIRAELLEKYDLQTLVIQDLSEQRNLIYEQLAVDCLHERTYDYSWVWDNGYGVQKTLHYDKCYICGSANQNGFWNKPSVPGKLIRLTVNNKE